MTSTPCMEDFQNSQLIMEPHLTNASKLVSIILAILLSWLSEQ